ncbi:MAG: NAD-dependent epimerase/dehydratase family protein, partial [Nanoarchaeota archaeon]
MVNKNSRIYVSGSRGFVGSTLVKKLTELGYKNIITSKKVDLTNQSQTDFFFRDSEIEYVFNCAAIVGGIAANIKNPFKFLMDNLQIQNNIVNSSIKYHIKKVVMLGSSCIYPKDFPSQPLKEEYLLEGKLEPTNEAYALAKIVGLKAAEYANKIGNTGFISLMPSNLYGPNDHFNLETSHALAASIMKIKQANDDKSYQVNVWGSGKQQREWLYIDDLIDCLIWSMNNLEKTDTFLNVGTGKDISMNDLVETISLAFRYI